MNDIRQSRTSKPLVKANGCDQDVGVEYWSSIRTTVEAPGLVAMLATLFRRNSRGSEQDFAHSC